MKRILTFLALFMLGWQARSASISLTIVTAPCDSNGVLACTVTGGGSGTYSYYWYTALEHRIDSGTAPHDTLHYFQGGGVIIEVFQGGMFIGSIDTVINLPFHVSVTATPAVCPALGTLSASVTGGTGPYTYEWITSGGVLAGTSNPASVSGGDYRLRVKDASGCVEYFPDSSIYDSSLYHVAITPDFTDSISYHSPVCPHPDTAIITVSGGTGPFTYLWTNSLGVVVSTTNPGLFTGSGLFSCTITDALGCTDSRYAYFYPLPDFTLSMSTTTANCTNGTASTSITGGVGPFTYLWSNGATTASISSLVQGEYVVHVTDANGCTATDYGEVNQAITITVNTVVTPATCLDSNGAATAFGAGGVPPYAYLWSNGATTQSVTGMRPASLDVTATDANGCFGTGYAYISTSTPITVTYSSTASSCTSPTGTSTLAISGGTPPYSVTWYTYPIQHTTTATSLAPGDYSFEVVDAVGCTQTGTVTVPPVDVIGISFLTYPDTCRRSDGKIIATASSGVPPYSYAWSNGATTATNAGIGTGTYYLTVTDAHGCKATQCQTVPLSSPLELGLFSTPASCLYNHNGSILASAVLGTPPYSYSMGGTSLGSVTIGSLATGPYWIYVTDAAGCTAANYSYVGYNEFDSSCFCLVKGVVYHDTNSNCIRDLGEHGIDNIQMHCTSLGYTYTDPSGYYYFLVPSGTYTISQDIEAFYPLSHCQSNDITYTAVAHTGCTTTINFADSLAPIHDMHVATWDYLPPVPGFGYTQQTVVSNRGTLTETSVLASYKPDGQLNAPTFLPSGIYTGSPYYYTTAGTFPSITPGVSENFFMTYNVPTDVPLGTVVNFKDSVAHTAPMSNWLLDYSPWDNVDDFNATVVASHDPNFMEVTPAGLGTEGYITYGECDTTLEFLIHFQNTGNYPAENVTVVDTLDPNLDWTSMSPVYFSNQGTANINESGVATFSFPEINLQPSGSEPMTSNAMLTYKVKMRPGLSYGTQIHAHAAIYFDYNAPIPTDTTVNTLEAALDVNNTTKAPEGGFTIYPNPAGNYCTAVVSSAEAGQANLRITDIEGRLVQDQTVDLVAGQQRVQLNTMQLSTGMYFVTFSGAGNAAMTQKLLIMK